MLLLNSVLSDAFKYKPKKHWQRLQKNHEILTDPVKSNQRTGNGAASIFWGRAMMYFEAIFQPSSLTNYDSDSVQKIVGKKIALQDGWVLEEGPHKGQQGYYLPNSTVGLIPASDLKEIRVIPYSQWKDIFDSTKQEVL